MPRSDLSSCRYPCSRRVWLTHPYTSSRFLPSNCSSSLACRNSRICSRLIAFLLCTLMINPRLAGCSLQANLVCETRSTFRLILYETRLPLAITQPLVETYSIRGHGFPPASEGDQMPLAVARYSGRSG